MINSIFSIACLQVTTQVNRLKLEGRRWKAGDLLDTLVFSLQPSVFNLNTSYVCKDIHLKAVENYDD